MKPAYKKGDLVRFLPKDISNRYYGMIFTIRSQNYGSQYYEVRVPPIKNSKAFNGSVDSCDIRPVITPDIEDVL